MRSKESETGMIRHIVKRGFDEYKPGDEYIPKGDKNEKAIIEFFCYTEEVEEAEAVKDYVCECGRSFEKPQGLSAHKRFCKGGK